MGLPIRNIRFDFSFAYGGCSHFFGSLRLVVMSRGGKKHRRGAPKDLPESCAERPSTRGALAPALSGEVPSVLEPPPKRRQTKAHLESCVERPSTRGVLAPALSGGEDLPESCVERPSTRGVLAPALSGGEDLPESCAKRPLAPALSTEVPSSWALPSASAWLLPSAPCPSKVDCLVIAAQSNAQLFLAVARANHAFATSIGSGSAVSFPNLEPSSKESVPALAVALLVTSPATPLGRLPTIPPCPVLPTPGRFLTPLGRLPTIPPVLPIPSRLSETISWTAPSKCPVLPYCITSRLGNDAILFVYEKPSADYFKKQSYYDTLGSLSHERWIVMEQIHIVVTNHESQFGVAKFLNTPHYQTLLPDLIAAADNFDGAVEFFLHPERSNFSSNFLVLGNNLKGADKLLFDELPFEQLSILLQENLRILGTPSGTPRQALYMDFGFTGRRCVSRVSHSPLGLARPVPKPLLDHPAIVKTFEILW